MAKNRILMFIGILILFTVGAYLASIWLGNSPISSLLIMWSPALAALAASLLTRRSLKEIGWNPFPVKWLPVGWALPMIYALPAYALVWLFGLGAIPSPTFLERARFTLSMPTGPDWQVVLAAFGYITLVNLIPAMFFSLGEEIGWRGFLVPELTRQFGFAQASLFSGLLWAAWHLPGILFSDYRATGTPLAFQLFCFTLMVVTTGVLMAWLRMKSGSIWPVVIMHATHNGLIQTFLDRLTIDTGPTRYFTGEFGIAMLPILLLLSILILRQPKQNEDR